MNILFFSENFTPEINAAASRVFERACYWVNAGHKVTVITCAPNFPQGVVYAGYKNKWFQQETIQGIKVIRVKTFVARNEKIFLRSLDFISYFFTASIAAFFQSKPDIVVATSPQPFAGVAGFMTAALKRIPFVLEVSDLWPASIMAVGAMKQNKLVRLLEKIELFLYRKADAIVTLTHSIKNDLMSRFVPSEKITAVLNGVDLSKYAPQPRNTSLAKQFAMQDDFVIGYIGTHGLAHGLENVLHTAKTLEKYHNVRFLFVGDGATKATLMEQAKELQLKNVTFISQQPKEKMQDIWSLCDIALIHLKNASLFAGAVPSKLFEAMGMGLPLLLVAPEGEASVIISGAQAGLWVQPENPTALAEAVLRFKNNPDLLQSCAQKSYQAAAGHTREKQAQCFLEILQNVLVSKKANIENCYE